MARTLSRKWELNYNWLITGKECSSVFSSRWWGGALRDDTKNGCVADYSLPGSPPTFEQARVLRTRLEKAWRLFNLRGDYKLLYNAANYYLLFGGQKVFLMAGRSPLKCDNSH